MVLRGIKAGPKNKGREYINNKKNLISIKAHTLFQQRFFEKVISF